MLVPAEDALSVFVPDKWEANRQSADERRQADIYRALVAKKIKKAQKENHAAQQKTQRFYDVERKELYLMKLRIANNENRAKALKLQNNLLFTIFWIVLSTVGLAVIVLYRWRIEHEKRTLQIHRAAFVAREQEKMRFSRELHDDFQSTLSIIHMLAVHEYDQSPQNKHLVELKNSSKNAMHEIRKFSDNLYPREINTEGCIESLITLIRRTNEKNKAITFFLHTVDFECDKDHQMVLYRSVEELVKNTLSSSNAIEVEVTLRKVNNRIELLYLERGISKKHQKRDKKGIQEHVHALGGKFIKKRGCVDNCEFQVIFSG